MAKSKLVVVLFGKAANMTFITYTVCYHQEIVTCLAIFPTSFVSLGIERDTKISEASLNNNEESPIVHIHEINIHEKYYQNLYKTQSFRFLVCIRNLSKVKPRSTLVVWCSLGKYHLIPSYLWVVLISFRQKILELYLLLLFCI